MLIRLYHCFQCNDDLTSIGNGIVVIRWSEDCLTSSMEFLAATKQLYEWFSLSVRLSVHPSFCLSHLFVYVPIIVSSWNFQELLPMTKVMCMQKVKVRDQRSRSQRSQPNHLRIVTPVWIHIWWWKDAYSLMLLRRDALLFFKVIC